VREVRRWRAKEGERLGYLRKSERKAWKERQKRQGKNQFVGGVEGEKRGVTEDGEIFSDEDEGEMPVGEKFVLICVGNVKGEKRGMTGD
jgi:hypothetical protein